MGEEVLESYIRQYLQAQPTKTVSFAWQGGEPTLLGVPFFPGVVDLQRKYLDGKSILNIFQTKSTLIDDEWAQFLGEKDCLIVVSIDEPHELARKPRTESQ